MCKNCNEYFNKGLDLGNNQSGAKIRYLEGIIENQKELLNNVGN